MWHPCVWIQLKRWTAGLGFALGSQLAFAAPSISSPANAFSVITNVMQFENWVAQSQQTNWPVRLEGIVCWCDQARGRVVLQDDSGTALIEMPSKNQPIQPGDNILIKGIYGGSKSGGRLKIGGLTIEVDCTYGMRERSGELSLLAGKYPISLNWFDGDHLDGLDVFYEGPDMARQSIPDAKLFHAIIPAETNTNWEPGLKYSAYEGQWDQMPDFQRLNPVKTGIATNFDIGVSPRKNNAGLNFEGGLEIQQAGKYRFTVVPHGRRQLLVDQASVTVIGATAIPKPRTIFPGQILSEQEPSVWAVTEGVVTFVDKDGSRRLHLELSSDMGNLKAAIADDSDVSTALLAGGKVQITGICRTTYTVNGQKIWGEMWVPNKESVSLLEVSPALWTACPLVTIGSLLSTNFPLGNAPVIHVAGQFCAAGPNHSMIIRDGTGEVILQTDQALPKTVGAFVEALGRWGTTVTNIVLRDGFYRENGQAKQPSELLPVLTTAEQIKQLTREEALRGYPVKIQGIVTWSGGSGAVLQDSGTGVFVEMVEPQNPGAQHIGEYWQVEGVTTAQFSPMVMAQKVARLGVGAMPNPIHPTWDQLMNGTLDTEYVEIQGVVMAIYMNSLRLLTHNGTIQVDLPELHSENLRCYQDALIRIRGCLWAAKDEATHVFVPGRVLIHNASISMELTAPEDPFTVPTKRISQLLLFNANASALDRIKVEGQIIHHGNSEYYLMDKVNGLQFITRTNDSFQVGDYVEVVGFPILGGPVPILREAVARRIGHGALPVARMLPADTPLNESYDSTLVCVKARLTSLNEEQNEQMLELQAGSHLFIARLNKSLGSIRSVPIGSQILVTGVYQGRGGDGTVGRAIDSFELLLNSPGDIRVMARPSWWTIGHTLTMVGILACFLLMALVWIGLLRRQVEHRTTQLRAEVQAREKIERQRTVEAERSRIARDLHDDLGSSLTEISLLADAGAGWPPTHEKASERFKSIGNKARTVVKALDVIVWLVNPGKDFLPFFINYLGSYAEEFLAPSDIACQVKAPSVVPHLQLTAQVRHNLFLAVKEALHNIVRHARANKVVVEIALKDGELMITIADNGKGFDTMQPAGGDGLSNFGSRLANIGGQCKIISNPESGTIVALTLPLPAIHKS